MHYTRIIVLILCHLGLCTSLSAQKISSQITDSNTGLAIPYVNIGVLGKNIGTVSDSLGNFELSLANAQAIDTLRLSTLPYHTKDYNIGELTKVGFPSSIEMDEKVIQLQEIVVRTRKSQFIQLGIQRKYCYPIPLYKKAHCRLPFPQENYRHEIGTRFTNTNLISIDSVQLNFALCNIEVLEFRLNVYSIKNEEIEAILSQPISFSKEDALNFPIINLTDYQLEVESDFLITLENHKQIENGASFIFANFKSRGEQYPTYYRNNSQGNWVKLTAKKSKPIGLSFVVFSH